MTEASGPGTVFLQQEKEERVWIISLQALTSRRDTVLWN